MLKKRIKANLKAKLCSVNLLSDASSMMAIGLLKEHYILFRELICTNLPSQKRVLQLFFAWLSTLAFMFVLLNSKHPYRTDKANNLSCSSLDLLVLEHLFFFSTKKANC